MKTLFVFFICGVGCVLAQLPDLDDFGRDLELPAETTPVTPPPENEVLPARHLFSEWESLEGISSWEPPVPDGDVFQLVLPKGTYLVTPNAVRIAQSYQKIANTVLSESLQSGNLLKVVLHADGNFSLGLYLAEPPENPVPLGVDVSPISAIPLVGMVTDIQVVDRSSPLVLNAFVTLQQNVTSAGWKVDRREFYFLPIEPGRVFFGLRLQQPE